MIETDDNGGDEPGALRPVLPRIEPPPSLENRVRGTLMARGAIASGVRPGVVWARRIGLLAAGVVLGVLVRGSTGSPRPAGRDGTPGQYALLLYGNPPEDTGAVHAARAREYGRWASRLQGARWVGGHELGAVIETLGTSGASPPGVADRLAGFFIIEAPSPERAAEVARSCPHLKYGGRIVVMAVAT